MIYILFSLQNGSTARDVAYQQGHKAVAELLHEYERRLVARSSQEDLLEATDKDRPQMGASVKRSCPTNPSYQDVIPSPKHSPLRAKPVPSNNHHWDSGEETWIWSL